MLPFRNVGHLAQAEDWDTEGIAPRQGKRKRNQAKLRHPEKGSRKIRIHKFWLVRWQL